MKYYRLNKDWEPFDEGDEFIKAEDGDGMYTLKTNAGVLAKIPTDLLDEVDDGGYWKPESDETYYYMDEDGDIYSSEFDRTRAYCLKNLSLGDCFRTEDDTQAVVDWLKARQRLIESGARFINSQNIDADGNYSSVYFDVSEKELTLNNVFLSKRTVFDKKLYFDDEQLARKSVKEHKYDWLTYLGVKEKNDDQD